MRRLFVGFVLLVLLAACGPGRGASPSPTPAPGGGIRGVVMLGPTCPVQRPGQPACETPLATTVDVATVAGVAVTTVRSGADGHFSVALPAGTYRLSAEPVSGRGIGGPRPETVTVRAGTWSEVTLTVDTGIR